MIMTREEEMIMGNDKKDKKAVESVRKYYNCNGDSHCLYYEDCQFGNGKNTSYDCCECGADDFYAGYMYALNDKEE